MIATPQMFDLFEKKLKIYKTIYKDTIIHSAVNGGKCAAKGLAVLHVKHRITGIICGRKVLRISFFAIVHEKTFAIQAILYIKIPAKIKSARKHLRMLPDSQNS